jgi:hypothetical protein
MSRKLRDPSAAKVPGKFKYGILLRDSSEKIGLAVNYR